MRRDVSECLTLRGDGIDIKAWTLNASAGGLRLVVDQPVAVGLRVLIRRGDSPDRGGQVVWTQDEPDGQVLGVQYDVPDEPVRTPRS